MRNNLFYLVLFGCAWGSCFLQAGTTNELDALTRLYPFGDKIAYFRWGHSHFPFIYEGCAPKWLVGQTLSIDE